MYTISFKWFGRVKVSQYLSLGQSAQRYPFQLRSPCRLERNRWLNHTPSVGLGGSILVQADRRRHFFSDSQAILKLIHVLNGVASVIKVIISEQWIRPFLLHNL